MKYTFLSLGLIMAGMVGIVTIVMFENITIGNESEYYVLKEAVEASMYESIDVAYYRSCDDSCPYGGLKIIKEKFVTNCTRRFYNSITGGTGYKLDFYDIMESPPKVSVVATSSTSDYSLYFDAEENDKSFKIMNDLSAIFELNY